MARDVETYLRELQAALMAGGADPALTQDALFDAEEYLRTEMAVGGIVGRGTATYESRLAAAVEKYGTPVEVAAAYLEEPAPSEIPAGGMTGGSPGPADAVAAEAATGPAPRTVPETATEPTLGAVPEAAPSIATETAYGQAPYQSRGRGEAIQPGVWHQIFGVVVDPAVYKALLYMILSLGLGIAYFTVVVTGISTAGGMSVLIIGIPLFVLVLGLVRAMAFFEGRLVEGLLGTRMPRRPRAEPADANLLERMWFWIKDGRTWASMAYLILMLPLGTVYFTVAVTGLATGFGLIVSPLANWVGGAHTFVWNGITHQWWMPFWAMPLAVIVGAVLLVAWLHLIRWIGRGHAAFAKAMLVRLAK